MFTEQGPTWPFPVESNQYFITQIFLQTQFFHVAFNILYGLKK